jgi:integrative and conjugative element protein (TIGR02256 family)
LSSTISQEHVALHAAIGARALRKAFESDGGIISVWRSSHEGGVYPVSISPSPLVTIKKKGWQICADQVLLESVRQLREQRLPAETGGILIGAVDHQYRIVYVVDALPAPSDSSEELTGFVRGSHHLTEALEQIEEITAKQLTYIGEWHSHPTGSSVRPSKLDRNLLTWLTDKMTPASLPAVMLIVGGRGQYAWYIG